MMIGARYYIGDGTADAPKSLTHDGSALSAKISTSGFSPNLYNGPWTVTAWLRPVLDSPSRNMYAFLFGGVGPYSDNGRWGLRYFGGSSYAPIFTVGSGVWSYLSMAVDGAYASIRINAGSSMRIPINYVTPVDRLAFFDDDYGRENGVWHGDITRICIFPRALTSREQRVDMSAREAAPVGAAHWWDFADAESGVATDRIGGVRLQIPPGFVTRATPWSS